MSHHCGGVPTDPALQKVLADIDSEINSLVTRICDERRAWITHLARSRPNGSHAQNAEQTETTNVVMSELQALDQQLQAYNIRAEALRKRRVDQWELTVEDLVEPEDARAPSTVMASVFVRKIIFSARLALHVHCIALQEVEGQVLLAFKKLLAMAGNIKRHLDEGREECLSCARDGSEAGILMLKATMAGLGLKTARQRIILEFFKKVVVSIQQSADSSDQHDVEMADGKQGEDGGWDDTDGSESDFSKDETMYDVMESEKRQTTITEYFPLFSTA